MDILAAFPLGSVALFSASSSSQVALDSLEEIRPLNWFLDHNHLTLPVVPPRPGPRQSSIAVKLGATRFESNMAQRKVEKLGWDEIKDERKKEGKGKEGCNESLPKASAASLGDRDPLKLQNVSAAPSNHDLPPLAPNGCGDGKASEL